MIFWLLSFKETRRRMTWHSINKRRTNNILCLNRRPLHLTTSILKGPLRLWCACRKAWSSPQWLLSKLWLWRRGGNCPSPDVSMPSSRKKKARHTWGPLPSQLDVFVITFNKRHCPLHRQNSVVSTTTLRGWGVNLLWFRKGPTLCLRELATLPNLT